MVEHALGFALEFGKRHLKWLGILAAVGAVIAGVVAVKNVFVQSSARAARVAVLEQQAIDQADDAARAVADRERQLADLRSQLTVVNAGAVAAEQRAARFATMLAEVENAPASDDGPLAPVFQHAAISLRDELRGTAPDV